MPHRPPTCTAINMPRGSLRILVISPTQNELRYHRRGSSRLSAALQVSFAPFAGLSLNKPAATFALAWSVAFRTCRVPRKYPCVCSAPGLYPWACRWLDSNWSPLKVRTYFPRNTTEKEIQQFSWVTKASQPFSVDAKIRRGNPASVGHNR